MTLVFHVVENEYKTVYYLSIDLNHDFMKSGLYLKKKKR